MTGATRLGFVLLVAVGSACRTVETAPGLQLSQAVQTQVSEAVDAAAFWNPSCDRKQIVVQRVDDHYWMVELSVCGEVRRYQCVVVPQLGCGTWLDVTHSTEARPAPRS